jgi:hypothetical protein
VLKSWLKRGKRKTIRPSLVDYVANGVPLPLARSMVGSDHDYDPFVPACSPFAHDPMGVSGGIAPAPVYGAALANALQNIATHQSLQNNWPSQAAQQWMASQQQNVMPQKPTHTVTVVPIAQVTRAKIDKLLEQLPMRVIVGISSVNFYSEEPMRFTVVYTNMRVLEFNDIDDFPSAAHVSRVLLDSP